MIRSGIAAIGLLVLVLCRVAWSDDPATRETWIDFSSDDQVGGLTHGFWVVFPPQIEPGAAKIRHAYGSSTFDVVLSGKKPVEVPSENETGRLLLYNFVAQPAEGDQLASLTFLFAPKDGTATGFFRLGNGQRYSMRGRAR